MHIDSYLEKNLKIKIFLEIWKNIRFRIDRLIKALQKKIFWKNLLLNYKNNIIKDLDKFEQLIKNNFEIKPIYLFFNIMVSHDPYIPIKETFKSFNPL